MHLVIENDDFIILDQYRYIGNMPKRGGRRNNAGISEKGFQQIFEFVVEPQRNIGPGFRKLGAELIYRIFCALFQARIKFKPQITAGPEIDHFLTGKCDPVAFEMAVLVAEMQYFLLHAIAYNLIYRIIKG
jgi:hypothetical protein